MNNVNIPNITSPGSYSITQSFICEVEGMYIYQVDDCSLSVKLCTFYKCYNVVGGALYYSSQISNESSIFEIAKTCFSSNYLISEPGKESYGFAIYIQRNFNGVSENNAAFEHVSICDHESSFSEQRDIINTARTAFCINKLNLSYNNAPYRNFIWMSGITDNARIISYSILSDNKNGHFKYPYDFFCNYPDQANDWTTAGFYFVNFIRNNANYLIACLNTKEVISNCCFIGNQISCYAYGSNVISTCIFDTIFTIQYGVMSSNDMTFEQTEIFYLNTYYCEAKIKAISYTCKQKQYVLLSFSSIYIYIPLLEISNH